MKRLFIICILFFITINSIGYSQQNIVLPDKFENDFVRISSISLGRRFAGENTFHAEIKNKSDNILYITLDLRSEPKDGFTFNWQDQYIYKIFNNQIKQISAGYELRLLQSESTIRERYIRFSSLMQTRKVRFLNTGDSGCHTGTQTSRYIRKKPK